jgi:hypothetical protein
LNDAFGRFWTLLDPSGAARPTSTGSPTNAASARDVRAAVTRLIETQVDLMKTVVEAGVGMLMQVSERNASTLPGLGNVEIVVQEGAVATEELWLHNNTAGALSGRFSAGTLCSGDGHQIPPTSVTFAPQGIRRLEPGASSATKLSVTIPAGQPPGRYFGFAFVHGQADAVAQLVVEVVGRAAPPAFR